MSGRILKAAFSFRLGGSRFRHKNIALGLSQPAGSLQMAGHWLSGSHDEISILCHVCPACRDGGMGCLQPLPCDQREEGDPARRLAASDTVQFGSHAEGCSCACSLAATTTADLCRCLGRAQTCSPFGCLRRCSKKNTCG